MGSLRLPYPSEGFFPRCRIYHQLIFKLTAVSQDKTVNVTVSVVRFSIRTIHFCELRLVGRPSSMNGCSWQ